MNRLQRHLECIPKKELKSFEKFFDEIVKDEHGRYRSWELCYQAFENVFKKTSVSKDEIEILALHLAFYLASWGMYRGSSFLQKKDYLIHVPVVKKILEYRELYGIEWTEDKIENFSGKLEELFKFIDDYYSKIRKQTKKTKMDISDILITKILMGSLGCVPAYDRFFKKGIAGISTKTYNGKKSLNDLVNFYKTNKEQFNKIFSIRQKVIKYPQMKKIDLFFWYKGFSEENPGNNQ